MPGMSGEGPERFFATQREWFARYLRILLEEAEPIVAENVHLVELLLMEAEVDAARRGPEAGQHRVERAGLVRPPLAPAEHATLDADEGFLAPRQGGPDEPREVVARALADAGLVDRRAEQGDRDQHADPARALRQEQQHRGGEPGEPEQHRRERRVADHRVQPGGGQGSEMGEADARGEGGEARPGAGPRGPPRADVRERLVGRLVGRGIGGWRREEWHADRIACSVWVRKRGSPGLSARDHKPDARDLCINSSSPPSPTGEVGRRRRVGGGSSGVGGGADAHLHLGEETRSGPRYWLTTTSLPRQTRNRTRTTTSG